MGRKIHLMLFILMITCSATAPMWAAAGDTMETAGGKVDNPFYLPINFFEQIIVSAAAGALVGSKFMIDIVRAYLNSDHGDSDAIRKSIIKFLTTVFIVMFASIVLHYITGIEVYESVTPAW